MLNILLTIFAVSIPVQCGITSGDDDDPIDDKIMNEYATANDKITTGGNDDDAADDKIMNEYVAANYKITSGDDDDTVDDKIMNRYAAVNDKITSGGNDDDPGVDKITTGDDDDTVDDKIMNEYAVIDDDQVSFNQFIDNLGWNVAEVNALFAFIQKTTSPQIGPGLAFGQFERRSQVETSAIENEIELEYLTLSKNMALTDGGAISFDYSGIYKITVQFSGVSVNPNGYRWHRVQIRGLLRDNIVGRSVLHTIGNGIYGVSTVSFFIKIDDINDVYMLEFVRETGTIWTLYYAQNPFGVDNEIDANIVVLVENVGQIN